MVSGGNDTDLPKRPPGTSRTRRVDPVEARVLGSLMEKKLTTPDEYPLTVSSLVRSCNQRSNREPVMELGEEVVRDALERLRKDVLVWRSSGARVERWEHRLTSRWNLDPPALAIMALLLLRGPQTPGELRSRSERLFSFADVLEVDRALRGMIDCQEPLARELGRAPGQREARFRHTMLSGQADADEELARPVAHSISSVSRAPSPRETLLEERVSSLERRLEAIERRLDGES